MAAPRRPSGGRRVGTVADSATPGGPGWPPPPSLGMRPTPPLRPPGGGAPPRPTPAARPRGKPPHRRLTPERGRVPPRPPAHASRSVAATAASETAQARWGAPAPPFLFLLSIPSLPTKSPPSRPCMSVCGCLKGTDRGRGDWFPPPRLCENSPPTGGGPPAHFHDSSRAPRSWRPTTPLWPCRLAHQRTIH